MAFLFLTEDDVRSLLTMDIALEAVEEVFRAAGLDEAENCARARSRTDGIMLHVMSAAAKTIGYAGYKAYSTSRGVASFHVGLFDGKSGQFLAMIEADYLGQVRTGAASGVATKYMARDDAATLGLFGSGKQARTQVLAIAKVRPIERIHVFSPHKEHRERFASEMAPLVDCNVIPVERPELAAKNLDIIVTATTSREPVIAGNWLADGCHINAIGSNFWAKTELDVETVRRAANVVVDNKEQARAEAGDFREALDLGVLQWSRVRELGQVVVGRYPGREHLQDITLFKSLGIALEDVATAGRVYELAKEKGIGRWIETSRASDNE